MPSIADVFWTKVDKNGPVVEALGSPCRLWLGPKKIYGSFAYIVPDSKRRRHQAAHRVAWILTNGRRIGNKKEICHRCDNPICVNPDHLFEGTHSENERDKVTKGRHRSPFGIVGGNSPRALVTDAQATQIRLVALDPTVRLEALAVAYGMSLSTIRDLLKGRTYQNLPVLVTPRRKYTRTVVSARKH